ncbi:MAG: NifU family protein, partial [Alphaproteobacteria bacterium]|nr:NifU family protein [Alphaproteobacteria bacterium]
MYIETEATPNPATLKFLPGRPVLAEGVLDMADAGAAEVSPLARRLFGLEGVVRVFLATDFLSVTLGHDDWDGAKPQVLGAIMDHFLSGEPVVTADVRGLAGHDAYEGEDAEIVGEIKELLDTRVRPAVAQDGGDIVFHAFRDGIVYLHMRGSCSGCPSSTLTLKRGIENMLKHYVPEVAAVEA